MPSFDSRSRSQFTPVPIPGVGKSNQRLGLLSAENGATSPLPVPPLTNGQRDPETEETNVLPAQTVPIGSSVTRQLIAQQNPNFTRVLSRTLSDERSSVRAPMVIKGQRKRAPAVSRVPHHLRRLVVSLVGVLILCLITTYTLLAVTPLGRELNLGFNPSQRNNGSVVNLNNTGSNSLVAQATATAVYYQQNDGYDPNASGGQQVTSGSGSLTWPVGQCTYWANSRYYELTKHWVAWSGNANQWVAGAQAAGWNVSTTPHVPSIIVLMSGVQGASSAYGHVAVVEKQIDSTTVYTSNMNWWADGGGWNIVSYANFTVGSGVYFVWHS